jgi:hypothetical protein
VSVDASSRGPRVTAIIAACNHEDTVGGVIGDLVAQGIGVYLIDHGSRDATVERAEAFAGRGLIAVERFAGDADALVRRKEELARALDADWILHGDADELRDGPWSDRDLRRAIATVDQLGYNAIDFELFRFPPTRGEFCAGDALRDSHRYCEPAEGPRRRQVTCWKRHDAVELDASGGGEARLPWQRLFPVRFIVRKYDARGAVRDPRQLRRFDAEATRLQLWLDHAVVDDLRRELAARNEARWAAEAELRAALERETRHAVELAAELRRLRIELDTTWAQMQELLRSKTWRWTQPARLALRLMGKP